VTEKENKDNQGNNYLKIIIGYYWGNEPYDSSHITDAPKSDDELKKSVIKIL
jgi:hypothetical protein